MRFKKMLLALVACMALSVVAASAAQAAPHWNVEGAPLSGEEGVTVSGGPWELNGTTLGTTVELDATKVECGAIPCVIKGSGESTGSLKYTEVEVTKPAHCTASNPGGTVGTIETNALKDQIIMDPNNGAGPVFDEFTPDTGSIFVEIEFHGEECALNEFALPVEGSAGGESPNATGVEAVEQPLTFGEAQQATSNSALTLGGGSVILSGTAVNKLTKGGKFGATE